MATVTCSGRGCDTLLGLRAVGVSWLVVNAESKADNWRLELVPGVWISIVEIGRGSRGR